MKQVLMSVIVVIVLLAFAGIGIVHILKPDYFMKRSGVRRGGELLTEWNRLGFQISGAVFAAFAIYLLYVFFRG
jgi:hypothetical protein